MALHRTVGELTGENSNANIPLKYKKGKALISAEEQVRKWMKHFQEILDQPIPDFDFTLEPVTTPIETVMTNFRKRKRETMWRLISHLKTAYQYR